MVEVFIGSASAFIIALSRSPLSVPLTQWCTLVGCVYVIARGSGNVREAMLKASKDFWEMVTRVPKSTREHAEAKLREEARKRADM
jgi:hypothetical protein